MQRQAAGVAHLPAVFEPERSQVFRYVGFDYDPSTGVLACTYALDGIEFVEHVGFHPPHRADDAAIAAPTERELRAFRLVYLLAGVSYYKAGCPPVIDLGNDSLTDAERALLEAFYLHGLGEFAYRNQIDLSHVRIEAPARPSPPPRTSPPRATSPASPASPGTARPLVPFGGGIDSIVSVEAVRPGNREAQLFVLNEFPAIEASIETTRLDVVRATRRIDPALLELNRRGARNGHVPITGILSAIAVASAVLHGADQVVMSNEWSASSGNLVWNGREINHQWSKSLEFETLFRAVVHEALDGSVDYFSLLRPLTSLRIAQLFAEHPAYLSTFRSCNRAFHIDENARRTEWCGECEKCAFVDLILSPFIDAAILDDVFGGREPLQRQAMRPQFDLLLSLGAGRKPFECVGDEGECRAAAYLAAQRPDRRDHPLVQALARAAVEVEPGLPSGIDAFFAPIGPHHVPPRHAATLGLG